jgi:hypothetical protein
VLYLPPTDAVDAEAVPAADPEPDAGREPVTERTP